MSKIFIHRVTTYSTVINKKCTELEQFVADRYSNLLSDHKTLLLIDTEIRNKILELEAKYPKSKKITCDSLLSMRDGHISAHPEGDNDKTIFILTYSGVTAEYCYDEQLKCSRWIQEGGLR